MLLYVIIVTICSLLAVLALCTIGYFAYKTGYGKGHATGYSEAEEKYKQPELTPDQREIKQKREKVEDHFNRLFAYSPKR